MHHIARLLHRLVFNESSHDSSPTTLRLATMMTITATNHTDWIDLNLSEDSTEPALTTPLGHASTQLNVDLGKTGKQHGHLTLPSLEHGNGTTQLRMPVCVVNGGRPGPVVCLLAGIHGDEYEGALTLHRLARELTESDVHGCLILLPGVNAYGLKSGNRCNPLDGQNIDYAFPGKINGSPSERLAYEITHHFIAQSDMIIDLRSGGQKLRFVPSTAVRFSTDKDQQKANENVMIAFGAPNSLRLPASAANTCLQGMASAMNKTYVQSELGGGSHYDAAMLSVAHTGCLNVLRHVGMLKSDLELAATRLLEVRDDSWYVYAECDGLYEPLTYPGEAVWQNEPMANIVNPSSTSSSPDKVFPPHNATLVGHHPGGMVHEGELIAVLADEVQG